MLGGRGWVAEPTDRPTDSRLKAVALSPLSHRRIRVLVELVAGGERVDVRMYVRMEVCIYVWEEVKQWV